MKRICLFTAILMVLSASIALSQMQQGGWEFSVSGAFASLSSKTEYSGSVGSHTYESEAESYFTVMLRPGFYVIDGLEIEPEISWGGASGVPPSYSFSGNASYNFLIPGSRVAPFVLAGYGIGNSMPMMGLMIARFSDSFDVSVLNAGAGLKVFATKSVAFRAEYRYQRFARGDIRAPGGYSSSMDVTYNLHNVFLGVSVFLP